MRLWPESVESEGTEYDGELWYRPMDGTGSVGERELQRKGGRL